MSNVGFPAGVRGRSFALAALLCGTALAAGCSTDVQRFGYTGSLPSTAAVGAAPVEPVQSASLGAPASVFQSSPTYATREASATPAAYKPSAAAAAPGYVEVRSGDTAYSIARRHGITVTELASANNLTYPYGVRIGQRLTIPGGGSATASHAAPAPVRAASGTPGAHRVAPGDTLYNISQRYGVGVGALADANGLDDNATIRIGQTLRIPGGAGQTAQGGPLEKAGRDAEPGTDGRILTAKRVEATDEPEEEQKVASAAPLADDAPLPTPPERAAAQFRWPVRGRLISRFGIASDGSRNDGINIAVPEGASVKAADNGVVAYAGDELKGYGNLVLIRHANDWVTAYAHNSEILVNRGDTVKRGQIIAKAGQSGSVDRPQVHFEVRRGAKAVDPMDYLDGA